MADRADSLGMMSLTGGVQVPPPTPREPPERAHQALLAALLVGPGYLTGLDHDGPGGRFVVGRLGVQGLVETRLLGLVGDA